MKMKFSNLKYMAVAIALSMTASSCGDFLDRPTEDSYNEDNYYDTDDQCISATNYLYNSPWYDSSVDSSRSERCFQATITGVPALTLHSL